MKRTLPYLTAFLLLQSCCAYHVVTLKNNSGEDKLVTLYGQSYRYYSPRDYFWLSDLSCKKQRNKTGRKLEFVNVDSLAGTYSFTLPKATKLVVQHGIGYPDLKQEVIVDNSDTIRLRNDPRAKLKARRLDNYFAVTVDIRTRPADATATTAIRPAN